MVKIPKAPAGTSVGIKALATVLINIMIAILNHVQF